MRLGSGLNITKSIVAELLLFGIAIYIFTLQIRKDVQIEKLTTNASLALQKENTGPDLILPGKPTPRAEDLISLAAHCQSNPKNSGIEREELRAHRPISAEVTNDLLQISLAKENESKLRQSAILALGYCCGPSIVTEAQIEQLLQDKDSSIRKAVIIALQEIMPRLQIHVSPTKLNYKIGEELKLDASNSFDPRGWPLTFEWIISPSNAIFLNDTDHKIGIYDPLDGPKVKGKFKTIRQVDIILIVRAKRGEVERLSFVELRTHVESDKGEP